MIQINKVTYKYPKGNRIIDGFSESFNLGEITALTGKNGCGKTTLTKLITGVLRPDSGYVSIDGEDISGMSLFDIGRRVGYLFQNPSRQLFCETVGLEIAYGLRNMGLTEDRICETVRDYLERFRLSSLKDAYPGKLSHGEKQRVMLAAVLSMGTRYLVLDEPTTGLDVLGRRQLAQMLLSVRGEQQCGILIVSHERSFIQACCSREVTLPCIT